MFRIGYGEDIHILSEGRKLYLGGVLINENIGCIAHSDGDVLLHSLVDAMLGALAKGDIGEYFSDKDPAFKDKESSFFVTEILKMVNEGNYEIENVDSLIVLENIKLKPLKEEIRKNVAKLLNIDVNQVNIKAGTNEKQDSVGQGKSIVARTVILLRKKD